MKVLDLWKFVKFRTMVTSGGKERGNGYTSGFNYFTFGLFLKL